MADRPAVLARQSGENCGPPTGLALAVAAAPLAAKAARQAGLRSSRVMRMQRLGEGRESGSATAVENGATHLAAA